MKSCLNRCLCAMFQLTAARRRLGMDLMVIGYAGTGFNSQPPEGGWGAIFNILYIQ